MAVQDCDKISNIVAISLLSQDDELSREIADLARLKNYTDTQRARLEKTWEKVDTALWKNANELELLWKSAEIKIDAIVQSYILKWQAWQEALMELAEQISKTKWSLSRWMILLDKVNNVSIKDMNEIARLWDDTLDVSASMSEMEDAISDFVASDYSIYRAYHVIEDTQSALSKKIKDAEQIIEEKKELLKNGIIEQGEFDKVKEEKQLIIDTAKKERDWIKKALEKDYKQAIDKIKKWWNPTGFVALDDERTAIKKTFWDDPDKMWRAWTNYIMAREIIAWWEMADEVLKVLEKEWENLAWELTQERIAKCDDLDLLLSRAFTNTEQLCLDWDLRAIYREKLIKLSAGTKLSDKNIVKVNSLINTSLFTEEWATLSDVMLNNRAFRSMKDMWYKVTEEDWWKILRDIEKISDKLSKIWPEENIDTVIKIAWQDMPVEDVIQLIYNITWDKAIIDLVNSKNFTSWAILNLATQRIMWNNQAAKDWIKQLLALWKWREWDKIKNARWIYLKTITWEDVSDWANVWYFNYREGLYVKDELSWPRAKLMDAIADQNRMRLEVWDFTDFTTTSTYNQKNVEELRQNIKDKLWGWVLIVNDARWWDNPLLREALAPLIKDKSVKVIYPRWWAASSMVVENGSLYFKTTEREIFDDMAWTISIQSMWTSKPTRDMIADSIEAQTNKNQDKIRYQAMYSEGWVDNLWNQLSDQQVEFFAKSVVRDENWNLIRVYHWTRTPWFEKFDGRKWESDFWEYKFGRYNVSFFTSDKDTAWTYAEPKTWFMDDEWDVIECYLNITNPIELDAKESDFTSIRDERIDNIYRLYSTYFREKRWWRRMMMVKDNVRELNKDLRGFWVELKKAKNWTYEIWELETNWGYKPRKLQWVEWTYNWDELIEYMWYSNILAEWMEERARNTDNIVRLILSAKEVWIVPEVDWIIIKNIFDAKSHFWNYWTDYITFSPNQIKSVENQLPTYDDRIMFDMGYHWSPVKIEEFDLKYVGNANWKWQWYGIYLTKDWEFARRYAAAGEPGSKSVMYNDWERNSIRWWTKKEQEAASVLFDRIQKWDTPEQAIKFVKKQYWKDKNVAEFIRDLSPSKFNVIEWWRYIYTVDFPDNIWTNYIEWWEKFGEERFDEIKTQLNEYIDNIFWRENISDEKFALWWRKLEDPTWEDVYRLAQDVLWTDEEASKFFESIGFDWNHYIDWTKDNYVIFNTDKLSIKDNYSWQLETEAYMRNLDTTADAAKKLELFNKSARSDWIRTMEDLANKYGLPIKFLKELDMPKWVKALWAYQNGIIYLADMVNKNTLPHEIFHGAFSMRNPEGKKKFIEEWVKLFWITGEVRQWIKLSAEDVFEEMLAEEFGHWARTWEFTTEFAERLWRTESVGWAKKYWADKVKDMFKDFMEWLGLMRDYSNEVNNLFRDIINCKYLADDWKPINWAKSLVDYNDKLNNAAIDYFWKMLWFSSDVVDEEYVKRVQTTLSDMLWMDINTFNSFPDKAELYMKIDKRLTLERLTTWRFDKEIVDIKEIRDWIRAMSNEDLAEAINKEFWNLVSWWTIVWNANIDLIKEARYNYNIATDMSQLLWAEWKIVSLVRWVDNPTLDMTQLMNVVRNKWDAERIYKEMFFPDQDVDEKDLALFIRQINWDIFDWLSIQFSDNLVKAGYSLPLVNTKQVVYDYLAGKLDLNSDFCQAFFYKNNIAPTRDNLNAIMDTMMPKEFKFSFETFDNKLADESLVWSISRVTKRDNMFLPDSYSALTAIEDAGRWVTLWNREYDVLKSSIDKYVKAMKDWLKNPSFKFKDAQKLKQDFSYAMDTFEQELIMPRYWKFLTPQERQALLWIKYSAPIWVGWQKDIRSVELMLDNWRNRILWWDERLPNWSMVHHDGSYNSIMRNMAKENDINAAIAKWYDAEKAPEEFKKRVENRRRQLVDKWATIKEINWEFVVYDVKESLWETVNTLPSNIQWVAWLVALGKQWVDQLTNQQAYVLLRYLEAAKALSATSNYATQLMYKQNPQLAQYSFFESYAIDEITGLPKVMWANSLLSDEFFSAIDNIANTIDTEIKQDIFEWVRRTFKEDWYILPKWKNWARWLSDIIDEAISRQIDDLKRINMSPEDIEVARAKMKNIYTNMFIPYTYLRDIPYGWVTKWWDALVDVKERVENTIKQAYNKAREDLSAAWASDWDPIQQAITIRLDDGSVYSLSDLWNRNIDDWKNSIFDDESIMIKSADDVDIWFTKRPFESDDAAERRFKREEKAIRENIDNQYLATLKSIENQWQIITDAERELMVSFMSDVRTDLRKYSLTNKMVDALDAVSWMWEEVARWLKSYVIGLWWMWKFWENISRWIWERYSLVRDAYRWYYNMSLEQLWKITQFASPAEEVAWNTARYFKNLERLLGSADWITWVTTNSDVNKAFFHIGEVFMNLWREWAWETWWTRWLFWMLSWIEQNQVLKFFKFSNPNQASYVREFIVKSDRMKWMDWIWWYRDYVTDVVSTSENWLTRSKFNQWFGTEYDDKTYKRVLQWLTWFTLTWWKLARVFNRILDAANQSRMAFRMLMSYPWQLLTIPQQWVSYFLKQMWFEKALWIDDMESIDKIRESFWILDWAYNELNIRWLLNFNPDSLDQSSFYNRYWIPSSKDLYENAWITTADDYINMYAKVDKKYTKPWLIQNAIRWFDPYKDNANNFIDWIFARNFKNIAFVKWLKDNNYMKFSSAEDFLEFMNDATISNEIKSKLIDAVAASSWRNFRNILWLWFGWLDRPVWWWRFQNILYWLMQMFNFRWSWWQNIFKQTWENFRRLYKSTLWMPWLSREARENLVQYLWNTPEFTNFVTAMIQDLKRAFKLQRFQDNGRWPDPETDWRHYFMDYLSYMRETMNMVSQWYQGIQSFWPMRPISEMAGSSLQSHMDPTIYQDTWWVWAFFNALWKNFGRQWKPANWLIEMAWAAEAGWWDNVQAYVDKQFFNLSFWSLRYMVNEDENAYWYTYEVTWQYGWIPGVVMWEAQIWSDKSFLYELDNTETWKAMQIIADDDVAWEDKKTYVKNLRKAFVNGSQLFKTISNATKVLKWDYNKVFFSSEDLADAIQTTDAGKEFYEKWYIIPKTPADADTFMSTILANGQYRPGSPSFYKSILQFEDFGHMAWKNWKAADADMELWLEHMKYKTDVHWQFVKVNWERVVEDWWKDLITNIKEYWYNKDYTTKTIYNYSKAWLDIHNSDPNYPLYVSMLWQWRATMLIDEEMTKRKEEQNKWKKGKNNKRDENENAAANERDMYLKIWNKKREWSNMTFFEELNRLDEDDATLVALKVIKDQAKWWAKDDIEKFFDITTDEKDWNVVENVSLKPQYESVLKQIWQVGRAIDEGNPDRVIASMSLLTHQFKNADPTGEVTATLINSVYDRIYEAKNLSPSLKNELMIWVFYDNIDMVQRQKKKLRALMWDAYYKYARWMNEMLHKWDSQIISNIDSIITSWDKDSSWVKSWRAASKALKNYAAKLSWISWDGIWTTYRKWQRAWVGNAKRVPVRLQWADLVKQLWLKWYAPTNVNEVVFKHTPTVDFSIQKDVRRNIKTKSTQTVSTKKQLSNIETKTTKALEAES